MKKQLKSLKYFFGENELKKKTRAWIDSYSPYLSDENLCSLFTKNFDESPTLFEIQGNARWVMESLMINYYHNEAFIKSAFISELRSHNSISFFELPVGNSRTDLCSINGNSIAYEIKTIADTTKRLEKQMDDYMKAFEYVYVICPYEKLNDVQRIVPIDVGIYLYDDKVSKPVFIKIKEAKLSTQLDRDTQISVLRKNEKPIFVEKMSNQEVNSLFKKALKARYKNRWNWFCENLKQFNRLDYQYHFNNF